MAYYDYKARNNRGELLQGTLEGADQSAVASYLLSTGATPIDITQSRSDSAGAPASLLERLTSPPVTSLDVQLFSRQMHTMLRANVPIMQGLKGLEDSASNKSFARILKSLRAALDAGRELSAAMREHPKVFSQYYVSMVQVGEMTGRLGMIFPRLHDYLQLDRRMQEQIKAALRYPKFVMFAIIGAIGVVSAFVIPQFAKIFLKANFELPFITRMLIATSSFTLQYWELILAAGAAATYLFRRWTSTKEGGYTWDKFKLKLPIAGPLCPQLCAGRRKRRAHQPRAERGGTHGGQRLYRLRRGADARRRRTRREPAAHRHHHRRVHAAGAADDRRG
jgi:MSHA biogenesis protein MshG